MPQVNLHIDVGDDRAGVLGVDREDGVDPLHVVLHADVTLGVRRHDAEPDGRRVVLFSSLSRPRWPLDSAKS